MIDVDERLSKSGMDFGVSYTPVFWDVETNGLNPSEDRLLVASFKKLGEKQTTFCRKDEEFELISDINSYLEELRYDDKVVLTGYNSFNFDIGFFVTRALINGVNPSLINKYMHMDLMYIAQRYLFANRLSQDKFVKRLGGTVSGSITGKDVLWLYNSGNWKKIKQHCEEDVEDLEFIYRGIKPVVDYEMSRRLKNARK